MAIPTLRAARSGCQWGMVKRLVRGIASKSRCSSAGRTTGFLRNRDGQSDVQVDGPGNVEVDHDRVGYLYQKAARDRAVEIFGQAHLKIDTRCRAGTDRGVERNQVGRIADCRR